MMRREIIVGIPAALTWLRLGLAPVVLLLAWCWPAPFAFALCLSLAFLSDWFDGVLARRLGVATEKLRRFDSIADTAFYLAALGAALLLRPELLPQTRYYLLVLLMLEASRYALDFGKFGREASYHMWSAKLWGVTLFAAFFAVLVAGQIGVMVKLALLVGIISDLEGFAISLLLPTWHHDVPSVWHAWRMRAVQPDP